MRKVAIIVKGYPRLSETFIAQEILALEQAGVKICIYSLRYPTDPDIHPVHRKIRAPVYYLPEYLYRHPVRVVRGLGRAIFNVRFYRLLPVFFRDFQRDRTVNRIRRFGQALVLAREIDPCCGWLYVHFLHTPASVARYASHLLGLPWSCSAHAKDIWTSPDWEIREKLSELEWLVTCTAANAEYLHSLDASGTRVSLLYHGLDLDRFPTPAPHSRRDGKNPQSPVIILSVGRAVNKKGYDVLLAALGKLPDTLHWHFVHIGDGPMLERLKVQAGSLGITQNVQWLGPQSFEQVLHWYRNCDLFVLASRIDADGDRDGLPNVLMEAMAQAVPCIASQLSGIPELIKNDINGVLVPAENSTSLCRAITRLAKSTEDRERLGRKGLQTVREKFSLSANIQGLVKRFQDRNLA